MKIAILTYGDAVVILTPTDRVAKYLKCEANRSWEYYFDKIQYNLNSI